MWINFFEWLLCSLPVVIPCSLCYTTFALLQMCTSPAITLNWVFVSVWAGQGLAMAMVCRCTGASKGKNLFVFHSKYDQGDHCSWKVMEFSRTIFQAWKVMENSQGHGKSWKMMMMSGNFFVKMHYNFCFCKYHPVYSFTGFTYWLKYL